MESLGGLGVAHPLGPFFAGAQGRQIVARNERRHAVQRLIVGVPLVVFEHAVGRAAGGVAGDEILDRPLDVRPVFLEERIVGTVERLAVGLQDAACVAVDEGMLGGRMAAAMGQTVRLWTPPSGVLLILEVDPPHSSFEIGEEPGEALLVAPDVRAGRLAAAVRAFPAVGLAVGDLEHDADVANRGGLRRDAVEQPVGKRAVVERLAERLGPPADRREIGGRLADARPWRRAKAWRSSCPSS